MQQWAQVSRLSKIVCPQPVSEISGHEKLSHSIIGKRAVIRRQHHEPSCAQDYRGHRKTRRPYSPQSAFPEVRKGPPSVFEVVQDDLRDEEAGNYEENIDSHEPARASQSEVKKQDAHYRHGPKAIDISAIANVHRVVHRIQRHCMA